MTLWVLRFMPVAGGHAIDARFRTEERLNEIHKLALDGMGEALRVDFRDDFKKRFNVGMAHYSLLSMSCEQSAGADKALHIANQEAFELYGLALSSAQREPGSSMQ